MTPEPKLALENNRDLKEALLNVKKFVQHIAYNVQTYYRP